MYPRGSEWRMWDLHVHTPDSITQDYTGEDKWDRFLEELAALPPDIKVLGINDYWFFDGYRKIRAEFDSGRFPNLDAVFPVLEVRCDTFGGTEGHLARLNLHLICDPLIPIDDLDNQLRPLMTARYQLTDAQAPSVWSELVTRDSLIKLGEQIIAAAPAKQRRTFSGPLQTGFANLNVSLEKLRAGIANNTAIKNHILLAVGKVEWEQIKWSQQSAAAKKTYINSVDAIFTAAPDRQAFQRSLASLKEAVVNHRLLDCSDAHTWTDSDAPNRLGNCLTWINADPTFKGLRQALQEYEYRVCSDERPLVLAREARSPQTTISEVELRAVDSDAVKVPTFDSSVPVNPGFVVVIGNKGQGKSALLDSVALGANSDREEDFSFLTEDRFRSDRGNEAALYEVALTWASGQSAVVNLNANFDRTLPVRVDYLPQSLIEKVCSADPDSVEKRAFESEIERVVFRHIEDSTRGAATSLGQLLDTQGVEHQAALASARSDIAIASRQLSDLNQRADELAAMGLEARESDLQSRLDALDRALAEVSTRLDSSGTKEQQSNAAQLKAATEEREKVATSIQAIVESQEEVLRRIDIADGHRTELVAALTESRQTADSLAASMQVAPDVLLQITYDDSLFDRWQAEQHAERDRLQASVDASGALNDQLAVADRKLAGCQEAMKAFSEETQALVQEQSDLRAQRENLLGEASEVETMRGVQALLTEQRSIPELIGGEQAALAKGFREAHQALLELMHLQEAAYEPATQFVEANPLAASVDLAFDVEFRVRGFTDRWLPMVNRQRLGNFHNLNRTDRDRLVLEQAQLDDTESLLGALNRLVGRLGTDGAAESGDTRSLDSIMRNAFTSADLLTAIYGMEWLQSQYIIRSEGSELSELSPGQRGLVLLLFYLLVDKSERPLLLDQPEENLDNQTVRNALVPALREAVSRRQVIAVTHNPNLAVVGDADQIIVAEAHGQFEYRSGSLAALPVGTSTIDVLEGTRAAFTSRQHKYAEVVGDS